MKRRSSVATKKVFSVLFLLGVALLWNVSVGGCSSSNSSKVNAPLAPDFKLNVLDDGSKALKDYRGKVVLLDFWSIGCPPCRRAVPHLVTLYEKYKGKGFIVLGISFDRRDMDNLKSFIEKYSVTYPILLGTMDVARLYGVRSIPSVFVLDKKGQVRLHRIGFNEEIGKEMEKTVKKLLKEK
jgi:peroxiredoxin